MACNVIRSAVAAGYSVVTRIPRGATNVDIRQYAPDDNKDDDIYLGNFLLTVTVHRRFCSKTTKFASILKNKSSK